MDNLNSANTGDDAQHVDVPVVITPQAAPPRAGNARRKSGENTSTVELYADGHVSERQDEIAPTCTSLDVYIHARSGWQPVDIRELYAYRDLFRFFVRREIKVRYAQSAIGVGWAILQPLFTMLIFTVIFGRLAKVASDGIPYALFSFAGLVPWMYFSNGVTDGVNSLIANARMLSKVYFPRVLLPLSAIAARFIDFAVASLIMLGMMFLWGVAPNLGLLVLPWLLVLMMITTAGVALWLSTFAIQFRDVKHAMGFLVQVLMYTAPVVYPASLIPETYQWIYALNPMVAVIEGLRSALFGAQAMPWGFLLVGTFSSSLIFGSGILYFNRKQRSFADVA